MSNEIIDDVNDDKKDESPEEKASKIDNQYNNEMKFIAKVLGGEGAINPPKQLEGDAVATLVARMFKEREDKLVEEVFKGLNDLVELHLKNEASIKEDENKLKQKRTAARKEFIKVARAWKGKLDQQAVVKEEYQTQLKAAVDASRDDSIQSDVG